MQCKLSTVKHIFAAAYSCRHLKGSVEEPNMLHSYETEKISRKASDAAENTPLPPVNRTSEIEHH